MNRPKLDDATAMNRIHEAMNATEWSADTLDVIAMIVELTGRTITDSSDDDDE